MVAWNKTAVAARDIMSVNVALSFVGGNLSTKYTGIKLDPIWATDIHIISKASPAI